MERHPLPPPARGVRSLLPRGRAGRHGRHGLLPARLRRRFDERSAAGLLSGGERDGAGPGDRRVGHGDSGLSQAVPARPFDLGLERAERPPPADEPLLRRGRRQARRAVHLPPRAQRLQACPRRGADLPGHRRRPRPVAQPDGADVSEDLPPAARRVLQLRPGRAAQAGGLGGAPVHRHQERAQQPRSDEHASLPARGPVGGGRLVHGGRQPPGPRDRRDGAGARGGVLRGRAVDDQHTRQAAVPAPVLSGDVLV